MSDLLSKLGQRQIIRKNRRYITCKSTLDGVPIFVKQLNATDIDSSIRRELWGLEAFSQLADVHDLGFAVPKILGFGSDYVITSWAEGTPLDSRLSPESFAANVDFFARSLAAIDQVTCLAHSVPAKFEMSAKNAKTSIDKLSSRLQQASLGGYIDPELITKSFAYLSQNAPNLTARLTHGDFTPGNVLEYEGQKTLVDYESVGLLLPRFYDVVNLTYNYMISNDELAPHCRTLLERYFEQNSAVDIGAITPQLNTIAMWRALAMIWELTTPPNSIHNTAQAMTDELGTRLSSSLRQLLDGKPYFEFTA